MHQNDNIEKLGSNSPSFKATKPTGIQANNLDERRADRFQLRLYRKLTGSSERNPDYFDRSIQEDIRKPHVGPVFK